MNRFVTKTAAEATIGLLNAAEHLQPKQVDQIVANANRLIPELRKLGEGRLADDVNWAAHDAYQYSQRWLDAKAEYEATVSPRSLDY